MKVPAILRRPAAVAPATRAELEAQRLIRARRLGAEHLAAAVGNLQLRCAIAVDVDLVPATLAVLHDLDELTERETRRILDGGPA